MVATREEPVVRHRAVERQRKRYVGMLSVPAYRRRQPQAQRQADTIPQNTGSGAQASAARRAECQSRPFNSVMS